MDRPLLNLRVFLSCPSGLDEEKIVARRVIDDINSTWGPLLNTRLKLWDYPGDASTRLGRADAQQEIFSQLGHFSIYVGVMHARFGSATERAGSGTEEEFDRAIFLHDLMETGRQQILFFFNEGPVVFNRTSIEQAEKVLGFKERVSRSGLYESVMNSADFGYKLYKALYRVVASLPHNPEAIATRPFFLHFLDHFFLEMLNQLEPSRPVRAELRDLVKLAFLISGSFYISCSSYVESPVCRELIDELGEIRVDETESPVLVRAVERGENWLAFLEKAVLQRTEDLSTSYAKALDEGLTLPDHVAFQPRERSATQDILDGWSEDLAAGAFNNLIRDIAHQFKTPEAEMRHRFEQLPEDLRGKDVIAQAAARVLLNAPASESPVVVSKLHEIINKLYFGSIVSEFDLAALHDFYALPTSLRVKTRYELSARRLRALIDGNRELATKLRTLKVTDYEEFRRDGLWAKSLTEIMLLFEEPRNA